MIILALLIPTAALAEKGADWSYANKGIFWLNLLHNNDGEAQLINAGRGKEDFGGIARFKTVVDDLRWDAINGPLTYNGGHRGVLMLSSGDNFLAGPEFSASLEKGIPFHHITPVDHVQACCVMT